MSIHHIPAGNEMRIVGPAKLNITGARFENLFSQTALQLTPPTLASIAPTTAVAVTGAVFTLTCTGTGFVSGISKIVVDGTEVPTTFVSATSLTTSVNPANFAAGTKNVIVRTYTSETVAKVFTFT
jgi:hypothetical protein